MNGVIARALIATGFSLLGGSSLIAQGQAFDRTKPPALRPPARIRMPPVASARLSNGLQLFVVEMHEVPLVQFTLTVNGGGNLDRGSPGMASFTASMLDEGAGTRTRLGVASETAYLGASLSTFADWDATYVSVKVPAERWNGPGPDGRRRPPPHVQPGRGHPPARPAAGQHPAAARSAQYHGRPRLQCPALPRQPPLSPAAHRRFRRHRDAGLGQGPRLFESRFSPENATIVVAGDITLADARAAIERRFGAWRDRLPTPGRGSVPQPVDRPTQVFLVDKPAAAQSVIVIGAPGVERNNPDYPAIEVMNTLLGGSFSSRLNSNLRELKGYTYGAGSGFAYRPLPGPFIAQSSVRTNVTDSAMIEFFKEFERLRNEPVDAVELERAKAYLALGLAGDFETTTQMAGTGRWPASIWIADDHYDDYVPRVMAVSVADIQRVARQYIRPDRFTIVVVGDIATIRAGVEALKLGPVSVRDMTGNEVQ